MRHALLVLLIAAGQSALAQHPPAPDLDSRGKAIISKVTDAETKFFVAWDALWRRSEQIRHSFVLIAEGLSGAPLRRQSYHCHPDDLTPGGSLKSRLIQNGGGFFAVCPSFDLESYRETGDERTRLDDALVDSLVPEARRLRAQLLATLDSAAAVLETNDFIIGQRVRFHIDQWEEDRAERVARACRGTAWWCTALVGYVAAMRLQPVIADSAFAAALAQMPGKERCRWNNHRLVVDFGSRLKYASLGCDERDDVNARLWWLADPLFMEAGNERRVEQHVRSVMIALRTVLDRDERYTWNKNRDVDAHVAMVHRYGWPSYSFWGGPFEDRSHTSYLGTHGTSPNPPYTTYEYRGNRVHLVPLWDAIEKPFEALPGDWFLFPQDQPEPPVPQSLTRDATPPPTLGSWWPVEHFAPRREIIPLFSGQRVLLRRESGALLAIATLLDAGRLRRRGTDTIPAITMVTSSEPGNVNRVSSKRAPVGKLFEMHALIESKPVIAGLEYPAGGGRGGPAGRLRFGITPPAPLSALPPDGKAISDPVILTPPADDSALPNDIELVLQLMAPSYVAGATKKIGVYWETYGFEPADTVELAVWIERYTSQGIGRRFGIVLGVSTDLNTPIAITWKEPQPGYRSHVFREGRVPVIGRSVTVDVSALPAGDYRLEVAVRKGMGEPIRGRSTFVVR